MKKRLGLVLAIAALGAAPLQGCGDDAPDDDEHEMSGGSGGKAGKGGNGGKGGAGGSAGASLGGGAGGPAGEVKCGSATCAATGGGALGGFATPCCADEASSTCGMSLMGSPCTKPVVSDTRCPAIAVMGFMLPSCCTSDDQCGIDASMFGMPGCVDLKSAAERSMMGGSGTAIPAPRACSAGGADAGI